MNTNRCEFYDSRLLAPIRGLDLLVAARPRWDFFLEKNRADRYIATIVYNQSDTSNLIKR
jgi:hypothetical protein